jgi:hypothetical protein
MPRRFLALAFAPLFLLACEDTLPDAPATSLPDDPGVEAADPFLLELPETVVAREDRFMTSRECALCHSNHQAATAMRDSQGAEIAPFNLWQGTMMANAARDPLWRAVVSAEVAATPEAASAIEAKCMRCHAPMASETLKARASNPRMDLLNDAPSALQQIALDGVSCTVCHQVDPQNLGTEESYSGGFVVGNQRLIYGPHQNPATGPMRNHVNYTPTYGNHVVESKMCATCHTVFTHALDEAGNEEDADAFPEQTPYLEWRNSSFSTEANGAEGKECQGCHMPTVDDLGMDIQTRIARSPPGGDFNINERSPFGRHLFVGANTLMPSILKDMRSVLNPQASDESFDAAIALAELRLGEQTSQLMIGDMDTSDGALAFDVTVHNEVGHKFPTGFPARRAWLHVKVIGDDGAVIFESGNYNDRGRIVAGNGEILDTEKAAGGFEPHHDVITRSDQVQIYESVMADIDGKRTPRLMRAQHHVKDNRLLPLGWQRDFADYESIKPRGEAGSDASFQAGQDSLRYEVNLDGKNPARVEVALYYQSLGSRFAMDLFQVDTDEVAAFRYMYDRADVTPVVVASQAKDL